MSSRQITFAPAGAYRATTGSISRDEPDAGPGRRGVGRSHALKATSPPHKTRGDVRYSSCSSFE